MFEHQLFTNFVYLLTVIDPISLVPEFIYVTRHQSLQARRRTALRAVLISAVILIVFIILGQILLEALGIGLPSFSIAGGLILLAISLQKVLKGADEPVEEKQEDDTISQDVAIFPLAMPYISGPATILAVVLLTDNSQFGFMEQAQTTLVLLGILVLTYLVLLFAGRVQHLLGTTGADVVSRIMGLILAALAVETILGGIRASFSLG